MLTTICQQSSAGDLHITINPPPQIANEQPNARYDSHLPVFPEIPEASSERSSLRRVKLVLLPSGQWQEIFYWHENNTLDHRVLSI